METLVLPAQDQFAHAHNHRLIGAECYSQNKCEKQWENPAVKSSQQQERNTKINGSERGFSSNPGKLHQHEKSCSSSPVFPNEKPILRSYTPSVTFHEGSVTSPGRRWHSTPCKLSFESNDSSIQATDQGFVFPRHPRPSKYENGRTSRSDMKNRSLCHSAMNRKRTGCDWKPVETGSQNCRAVPIPKQRSERKSPNPSYEINTSNEVSSISPPPSPTENWAGPAYSNSPPPSSLPFPKFSMRQMRSVSLEPPSTSSEFSDALSTEALCTSSWSVPTSPSREVTPVVVQGFVADVASATKNLKRILHLDLGD
ncbi:hypothetical protein SUGI_0317170 [Cryptomeria japonica]|uniref:uncharacterized protein LOC131033645 n=1 Tax=Cryptomeria japonica TaxID=3369 RepID=UPI002408AFF9|nr:uncharacterized protein LOC131033645 [Cryptomeria japonica]GLJ18000.1 hypothetical protein SUGI_0317170 [Cryptomeria japonica]